MTVKRTEDLKQEYDDFRNNQPLLPSVRRKTEGNGRGKNDGETGKNILLPHLQKGGKL